MNENDTSTHRDDYRRITEDVLRPLGPASLPYFLALGTTFAMICLGAIAWVNQIWTGIGVSGLQHPIMWAVYITNFVWWIGIAHSGTLISAILYLFRAPFRSAFSRASEAMTIIAIITAGLFPLIHLGRVWRFYWLTPYPNARAIWPNFRSSLILDVFAVSTYFAVSLLFFWLGLVPDLAAVRDRVSGWGRTLYGLLSVGWEGSSRQWRHYLMAYGILAGLATPLVISVHSVVSWDFAFAIVPGWHSTIFAPYFVAGAIFSGLAMVLTLIIPLRALLRLRDYITLSNLESLAVLILFMSLILTYAYALEYFTAWYARDPVEETNLLYKACGAFTVPFWVMTVCNSFVPLALFWRRVRRSILALFIISLLVNVGMWLERFIIIAGSLARGYDPYSWAPGGYRLSWTEAGITLGSLGWFLFWFLVFAKTLPVLPIAEVKGDRLREHREGEAVAAAKGGAP